MTTTRRTLLLGSMAFVPVAMRLRAAPAVSAGPVFTPEAFGAKGDGITNDSAAMARLSAAVNIAGGGTVSFGARKTYIVGSQTLSARPDAGYLLAPQPLLGFSRCRRPLSIRGNGARLRCAPGLLYGTFDRLGRPTRHKLPWSGNGELATPYDTMLVVSDCSGPVEISDLELDGNIRALRLGGPYGDTGMQIPARGLALLNNSGSEIVRNVYTHHHGQDGLYIDGVPGPTPGGVVRRITGVRCEYNGRQGCSLIAGRGYVFQDCKFNHTGRAGVLSAPGAGVDIEGEGRTNRDYRFVNCEFADNGGCGMVADSGDSEGVTFENCRFVGTTSWAAWPCKPRFRFYGCTFVGPIVQCFSGADPERAAQFHTCRFTDDPKLSPTGEVYASGGANSIADLGAGSKNVLFDHCVFQLTGKLVLPWCWEAIFSNCQLSQKSTQQAYPKGTYVGTNSIVGNVDLWGTKVIGSLTVNGRPYGR